MLIPYLYRVLLFILRTTRIDHLISDKAYLRMLYRRVLNKKLNLELPTSYNEKLQWLKLYNRNPLYTTLVDKYEVKKYVGEIIGEEYIIPTLGVWESFDEIDFDKLPNQFVLKCTHDSGGVVICTNKESFDYQSARRKLNKSLSTNYYWQGREWPYKNVKARIIAESYMIDENIGELPDYKFFCFDGTVRAVMLATERQTGNTKFDFYDTEFKHLPLRWGHDQSSVFHERPMSFDDMLRISSLLSKGFPHVRVDLYNIDGKIYFGELTFTHWSGLCPFEPEKWDYIFGDWLKLPH